MRHRDNLVPVAEMPDGAVPSRVGWLLTNVLPKSRMKILVGEKIIITNRSSPVKAERTAGPVSID
jgi:hypothetical protein